MAETPREPAGNIIHPNLEIEGVVVIPPDLLAKATPEEREAYFQYLIQEVKRVDDWEAWIKLLFPRAAPKPFSAGHRAFYEWVWSVEKGTRPKPWISIWSRGFAKSTSAELAIVSMAARGRRNYGLVICHEKGTPIFDSDGGRWIAVEEHPTAQERHCDGLEVRVWGLPFTETVTTEHRYWARTIHRKDFGHGRPPQIDFGDVGWIESKDLDKKTWVGLPIDETVEPVEPWLDDPDLWWMIGLWWGDGTLNGSLHRQISFSMGDKYPEHRERFISIIEKYGLAWKEQRAVGRSSIWFTNGLLASFLQGWNLGGNSQKSPPGWVEKIPLHLQAELIRGYVASDGWVTDRDVQIASVSLTGLLAARRILARLGVPATIKQVHKAGPCVILGRHHLRQDSYALRFQQGASSLGFPVDKINNYAYQKVFIRDGHLWSRVRSMEEVTNHIFIPIQTPTQEYLTAFGKSHNCETQEQADDHVANVAALLESSAIELAYPQLGEPKVGKHGNSKGWRRNRIWTASGFVLDAMGLDSAARGVKLEEQRPDLLVFDDIDGELDTEERTEKKIKTITRKLLPAGSQDCAILMVQNLVHDNSIFAQLSDGRADFLRDRIISGPIPAINDLEYEEQDGLFVITGGTPTWPDGFTVATCQLLMNDIGLSAFLAECQHETKPPDGDIFSHIKFARIAYEDLPKMKRTVVWVDPAVTSTDSSDSMGIQCDGLGVDGKIYRLWSWENRGTPYAAIHMAVKKALEWKAEVVGIETNQGGDIWRVVFDQVCDAIRLESNDRYMKMPRYKERKATSDMGSKITRAERMLVDYERGVFIHMEGTHQTLERSLNRFPKVKPYDLVDAATWCWMELAGPLHRRKMKIRSSARRSLSEAMGIGSAPN